VRQIASELKGHFLELSKHRTGSHVLKKMIERAEPAVVRQIASELSGHVLELANDKVGV